VERWETRWNGSASEVYAVATSGWGMTGRHAPKESEEA